MLRETIEGGTMGTSTVFARSVSFKAVMNQVQ